MLYKNPQGQTLTLQVGDGPGRVINYTAAPGGFVDGPEGYRKPFKRKGFVPVDELPENERPQIQLGSASAAPRRLRSRPSLEQIDRELDRGEPGGPAGDDLGQFDDANEVGEPLERAMSTRDRRALAGEPGPAVVETAAALPPTAAPAVALGMKLTASGTMRVEDVEPLPPLPTSEPDQAAQEPAGEPGVIPPGALLPGMPAPPTERETKPEKPSSKAAKK